MEHSLELIDVSKRYQDFSLDKINLVLPKGSIMGFIGENGAGKSTTIKLILDLIDREQGTITILGQDNRQAMKLVKEQIGVVMDESCFPATLNANNINMIMSNLYKTWNKEIFYQYLKRFQLASHKAIKDYSKGMKMKLSIAVALSHGTKLLILDEATSGLDPIVREEILDVFMEFIHNEQHSIFMSSHIISDLEKVCDYITFIHRGKIVFSENKDELLEKYGILKCSMPELQALDQSLIVGYRKNSFGVEALVDRRNIRGSYIIDSPTLEDIMVFYVKERR